MNERLLILVFFILSGSFIHGQDNSVTILPRSSYKHFLPDTSDPHYNRITDVNPRIYQRNDTVWIFSGLCKTLKVIMLTGQSTHPSITEEKEKRIPFLTIHGNIQYDFTYRSLVDTPFAQRDFAQHTLQTTMDAVVRDKYPVRIIFLARRNNSPYFENITDVNVQFNRNYFINKIKDDLRKQIPQGFDKNKLNEVQQMLKQKTLQIDSLQKWLNHPARIEEIIEEHETAAKNKLMSNVSPSTQLLSETTIKEKAVAIAENELKNKKDSLLKQLDSIKTKKESSVKDSSMLTREAKYKRKKEELEKSIKELDTLEKQVKTFGKKAQDSLNLIKQEIAGLNSPDAIKAFIKKHGLSTKDLPAGWQTLMNFQTVGIGRNWIDYSELTVKNISLTGINVEVTPSTFYFAFAAGKVNYRFRDFVLHDNNSSKQTLWLARAGIGSKEGNHLIFTYYDGKRNLINSFNNISSNKPERVIGVSIENRLAIDENNFIEFEVAKSSFQNTGTLNQGTGELMKKVWNLKDHSNQAYSIKFNSYFPQTFTKISGYYKKTGEHFQSFNLLPVNVDQDSYQAKVKQELLKQKLTLEAGIRKNDFTNPFINPGLSSKTVFKSFQASLRVPKYPFVSIGYYPSSQLTILNNNVLVENQYNTLSVVTSYSYRVRKTNMNSSAVYLKFYNHQTDTSFIYYNASCLTVNQNIFWKSLQVQSSLTMTKQQNLKIFTVEQSVNYLLKQWLMVGGSLKCNEVNHAESLWGGSININFLIKKIGTIQLLYDKSYLPGSNRNLLPLKMGRISYYRIF